MPITRLTKPDSKFRLDDVSTDPPRDATKQAAAERLKELGEELLELQELMWGARTHSIHFFMTVLQTGSVPSARQHAKLTLVPLISGNIRQHTSHQRRTDAPPEVGRTSRSGSFCKPTLRNLFPVLLVLCPKGPGKERQP